MKQELTQTQKDDLFQTIILDNAANKFVYNQLKQTLIDNPNMIVPFVGAGLSQFSYKAWGALLQDLLDQLADEAIDEPRRTEIQKKITDGNFFSAADDLETVIESDVFFFSLVSACNESKLINNGIPDNAAVRWLPKVFPDSRIITTNYDCVLEMAYAQDKKYLRVCTPSDSRMFMQFMPRRLFKIHGSYDSNYEDIVLTSKSYEEKYAKGGALYNNFKHIVQSSILFFLGASLRTDKTLDILKEIAADLSFQNHYCGNMHYAIVHIDDDDKLRRRQELAQFKILPILYSDADHQGVSDAHAIVGIVLEHLYGEVKQQFIRKTASIPDTSNDDKLSSAEDTNLHSRISSSATNQIDGHLLSQLLKQDPLAGFRYALSQNHLPLAESMLNPLEHVLPRELYITKVVSPLASRGSSKAAKYLFDEIDDLIGHNEFSVSQIIDVAGALVSYCNAQDKEVEYLPVLKILLEWANNNPTPHERAAIYNQYFRLYYGAYESNPHELEYCNLAKDYLKQAISLDKSDPSYYYNLAIIQSNESDSDAISTIEKCLQLDKEDDIDHLKLAYKIFRESNHSRADEVLKKIQIKNPLIAQMLSMEQ